MSARYKRKGEMLVYYDERGEARYGFEFSFDALKKFVRLTDDHLYSVVLPDIFNYSLRVDEALSPEFLQLDGSKSLEPLQTLYMQGCVVLDEKCFKGVSGLNLVVPFSASVRFDPACFDKTGNFTLTIPESMCLKKVTHTRLYKRTGECEFDSYFLVADKNLSANFNRISEYGEEKIEIEDCKHPHNWNLQVRYNEDVINRCK